jgi:hypothetical protein
VTLAANQLHQKILAAKKEVWFGKDWVGSLGEKPGLIKFVTEWKAV